VPALRSKSVKLTIELRIIVLQVLGIVFVVVGVLALLPIGVAPVSAVYYTVQNPYFALVTLVIGIIIHLIALTTLILSLKSKQQNNR
jgi:hypothetical protein